jgi:hypothetical protein
MVFADNVNASRDPWPPRQRSLDAPAPALMRPRSEAVDLALSLAPGAERGKTVKREFRS